MFNPDINVVYTFETYAPDILGTMHSRLICIGILNFDLANREADVYVKHQSVYPFLPDGSVRDPRSIQYFLFKSSTGEKIIFGQNWVKDDSVVINQLTTGVVTINNITVDQESVIRNALLTNGITNFIIEFV